MKSPDFSYCRPQSMSEVFDLLANHGDNARILAGGQSLMPSLNMRLSKPALLIDINRIKELGGIEEQGDDLKIGALARHFEVETSPLVAKFTPLLHDALPHVAHTAIRSRGSFGGSLAYADAAAEIPAITLIYEGRIQVGSKKGLRQIAAIDFFQGLYSTALEEDEIITSVLFPKNHFTHHVFKEFTRRQGDYATVGIAVAASAQGDQIKDLRIVYFGISDRPLVDLLLAQELLHQGLTIENVEKLSKDVGNDLDITTDIYHDASTKLHLLQVIVKRSLFELLGKIQDARS